MEFFENDNIGNLCHPTLNIVSSYSLHKSCFWQAIMSALIGLAIKTFWYKLNYIFTKKISHQINPEEDEYNQIKYKILMKTSLIHSLFIAINAKNHLNNQR